MDLFTPVVAEERLHPNFARVNVPDRIGEREIVLDWAKDFPDRDNKFVQEFQTTFNSSFWEIYLHGLFKSYEFSMDWKYSSPDFWLKTTVGEVIVEAVSANSAVGAIPEWEKYEAITKDVREKKFWPLNRVAIIRLANAILGKMKKYEQSYSKFGHVKGKPFVIAVAPFEQPDFQHQYDRAMRALLYDDYVDEDSFFKDPMRYPNGPESISLGYVEKDNGASISLGIFQNESWSEISAIIFSCVATWGKTVAMSHRPMQGKVLATWGTDMTGKSTLRTSDIGTPSETISDGLQIFHNPYARYPLDLGMFRRPGVVQHYLSPHGWFREEYDAALQWRLTYEMSAFRGD